jgi:DNA-binding transcriptional ArsR family regulator
LGLGAKEFMGTSSYQLWHRANDNSLDAVYSAIADPTRRELMELLVARELSITALAKHFPISRVAISKHLSVLQQADLVLERKVGREHRYRLNPKPLRLAHDWLEHYEQFWDEKLANLKTQVEDNS